jgi:hypothetical protein
MQQMAHKSDAIQEIGYCTRTTFITWPYEVHSVIRFLWAKHVSTEEIDSQLTEMYDDGVTREQHVRKWCTEFENGRIYIRDLDRTGQPNRLRTGANAAQVGEPIFGNREVEIRHLFTILLEEVEVAVRKYLRKQKPNFYRDEIFKLMHRRDKCFSVLAIIYNHFTSDI